MCFYVKISKTATELENRFGKKMIHASTYNPAKKLSGFSFPKTPVITNKNIHEINLLKWGLIPAWSKNMEIEKYTLNAKIETLHEKPSFKNIMQNTCLIIVDGFYEWQWLDEKGKNKQGYEIHIPNNDLFCLGGLWTNWQNKITNEWIESYTIITTSANTLMEKIHNTKKRMPLIIHQKNEENWLSNKPLIQEEYELIATKI